MTEPTTLHVQFLLLPQYVQNPLSIFLGFISCGEDGAVSRLKGL